MELLPAIIVKWLPVLFVLTMVAMPYLGGPLLILCTQKFRSPVQIEFFDPATLKLPDDVARFVLPARDKLLALGFQPVSYFCMPNSLDNAGSISILLHNVVTNDAAMINCVYAFTRPSTSTAVTQTKYVEFCTQFRDGEYVCTSNAAVVGSFRRKPNEHYVQFWDIQNIAELYRRHQRICEKVSSAPRIFRLDTEFGNDVEQYLQSILTEDFDYQVEAGLYRQVLDGYRPTVRGAILMTWQQLWPGNYFRRQTKRREAQRWLEEIGA